MISGSIASSLFRFAFERHLASAVTSVRPELKTYEGLVESPLNSAVRVESKNTLSSA